jgi:hypothetical protein
MKMFQGFEQILFPPKAQGAPRSLNIQKFGIPDIDVFDKYAVWSYLLEENLSKLYLAAQNIYP